MLFSELLDTGLVLPDMPAQSKDDILAELLRAVAKARGIDPAVALKDISASERHGVTLLPLDDGTTVALPHARSTCCKQMIAAIGVCRNDVRWGSEPSGTTRLVILLLGPPQARPLYLRVLSRAARLCTDAALVKALLGATSPAQAISAIAQAEAQLPPVPSGDGMPSFCVIGAGPGGAAMAGHLSLTGCKVNLFTRTPERLEPLRARGGIDVTGEVQGFARLNRLTTNVVEAVTDVDILMVVVPATAHRDVAALLAPHLRDGQVLVLNPGRTCGALEVAQVLQEKNPAVRPYLAEAQTLLYASRLTNPGQVHIFGIKNSVPLATLPAYQNADVLGLLQGALPQFVPGDNVLKTSLDNIGAVFHPTITMLNAGRIEDTHGDFDYYVQGVTPSIAQVLEAVDKERVAVAGALGIRATTAREWLYLAYNAAGKTLLEAMRANPGYRGIRATATLDHRSISEDVPTSLVPIASIGSMLGVPTPTINAVIQLASAMHGIDYWAAGRTVERLGIAGMSVKEIRFLVVGADPAAGGPPAKGGARRDISAAVFDG